MGWFCVLGLVLSLSGWHFYVVTLLKVCHERSGGTVRLVHGPPKQILKHLENGFIPSILALLIEGSAYPESPVSLNCGIYFKQY